MRQRGRVWLALALARERAGRNWVRGFARESGEGGGCGPAGAGPGVWGWVGTSEGFEGKEGRVGTDCRWV